MDTEQLSAFWDGLDWTAWESDQIEAVRAAYRAWLHGSRLVRTQDPDTPGDLSGHLVEDHDTTLLDHLLMYETLGQWASGEYTGASEATYISGMGLRYLTHGEGIAEQMEEDAVRVLVESVSGEVDDHDDLLYTAMEFVHQYAPVDTWETARCADAVGRDVWIEALADHIRVCHPDPDYVDALATTYQGIAAFQLPVATGDGGDAWGCDTTRWLIACDWLDEQNDGGRVADAIRAVIR